MATNRNDEYRLTELHRSGYEIAPGDADVRGWKVINGEALTIGEVVELLFDPLSQSVRYLVVNIEGKPINLASRDVLIPIGLADVVEDTGIVAVPTITLGQLAALPTYRKSDLNNAFERTVRRVFLPTNSNAVVETEPVTDEFYNHDHFNRKPAYSRQADGPVVIENDNTGRERIIPKEKTPASDQVNGFVPFKEGAIEFTEHREVPVITKQARVTEEVRVNRDVTERDEVVRDTVRRTEVDIEPLRPNDR